MKGSDLKNRLKKTGLPLSEISGRIGITAQALNQILRARDVKSGFIESLSEALNISILELYGLSQSAPITAHDSGVAMNSGTVIRDSGGGDQIGTQNNYGLSEEQKKDSISTLTETVATLTKELDTSQQQKSHLIEVVATSQQQILQLTELIDRLTK